MKCLSLYFDQPEVVAVRERELPEPAPLQVLVATECSAISAGTEMLVYRGQFPDELPVDEGLTALKGAFHYPLNYGYACVGKVIALGEEVNSAWLGRRVFAFNPHESHFLATLDAVISVPGKLSSEKAALLPNMETAVNFIMDGKPLIGEHIVVFGQGVVGLLTTALLAQFPLGSLVTLDPSPRRRAASLSLGASNSLDPADPNLTETLAQLQPTGADLTFELTGVPQTLDQAITATGFSGRIVIGSWYGKKRASVDLGGRFHRDRLHLVSSQVSTLAPEFSGRWTKERRFEIAWNMLARLDVQHLITHRFPLLAAKEAYQMLDHHPEDTLQILFLYAVGPTA